MYPRVCVARTTRTRAAGLSSAGLRLIGGKKAQQARPLQKFAFFAADKKGMLDRMTLDQLSLEWEFLQGKLQTGDV
jgi:hypothetical protein